MRLMKIAVFTSKQHAATALHRHAACRLRGSRGRRRREHAGGKDGGEVAEGAEGEEERGDTDAQRAAPRRRLRGRRCRRHRGHSGRHRRLVLERQGRGDGEDGHGRGLGRDLSRGPVRGGRGSDGRRPRPPHLRRELGRQRPVPRRHIDPHRRRRHR